jgi:hypothetical protein
MANPLPNEQLLYERIKEEGISIDHFFWLHLYVRISEDLTVINLICQYHLMVHNPIPPTVARKILTYTRDIKDVINQFMMISNKKDFLFPAIREKISLHPVIKEILTHYLGNDVYMINLIVGDCVSTIEPRPLSLQHVKEILCYIQSIKNFMKRLREAVSPATI